MMEVRIEESWKEKLGPEFSKPYFNELVDFVRSEYESQTIYPPGKKIFNAFDYCPLSKAKIVILGQDPYHGQGQANGLCFSVNDDVKFPPSLVNIFKEVQSDTASSLPSTGNLERWANQGVLLLNATLTVRANQPGSHQNKGWGKFTDEVIRVVDSVKEGIVFMLWGAYAQRKGELIDSDKHLVLSSPHPSPFSADRGFFGCQHFSKANAYLSARGSTKVTW